MVVRWVNRRDLPAIIEIDRWWAGQLGWNEDDFTSTLQVKNSIALVVEEDGEVCGYAIYFLKRNEVVLHRIAVSKPVWRTGVGRKIVDYLKKKVDGHVRRNSITMSIPEDNMRAQVWAREMGFRCERIVSDHDGSCYSFRWQGARGCSTNRIVGGLKRGV